MVHALEKEQGMKRILIAVTAMLALGAGGAVAMDDDGMMAEGPALSFSGSAGLALTYMGQVKDGATITHESEMTFNHFVKIGIAGAGTTDGGLTFGADVRINTNKVDDADVFIGGDMWTLTVGTPDRASDLAFSLNDVGWDGNLGVDDVAEGVGKSTGDAQARFDLKLGSTTLAFSVSQSAATERSETTTPAKMTDLTFTIPASDPIPVVNGKVKYDGETVDVEGTTINAGQAGTYDVDTDTDGFVTVAEYKVNVENYMLEVGGRNRPIAAQDVTIEKLRIPAGNFNADGEYTIPAKTLTVESKEVSYLDGTELSQGNTPVITVTIPARKVTITRNAKGEIETRSIGDINERTGGSANDESVRVTSTLDGGPDALSADPANPTLVNEERSTVTIPGSDAETTGGTVTTSEVTLDVEDGTVTVPAREVTIEDVVLEQAVTDIVEAKSQETHWTVGVKAALGPVTFGLGVDSNDAMMASVGGGMDGFGGSIFYGRKDGANGGHDTTSMGAEGTFKAGDGTNLNVVYAQSETGNAKMDGFGLGVTHDLGGGAKVQAGLARVKDRDKFSAGVTMSF